MWSALPVFRNWTAASKVEGEHRFKASRRAASSSGANGLVASVNDFEPLGMGDTESNIGRSLYVTVADKVNPILGTLRGAPGLAVKAYRLQSRLLCAIR
jgi:hypothetical protein